MTERGAGRSVFCKSLPFNIRNQVEVLKEVGTDYALLDINDEEHPREGPSKT